MKEQYFQLQDDRFFDPEPGQRQIARVLYKEVAGAPLVCPHGHVDPRLFSNENARLGTPADLLIIPDHYVFRMLYSQGIPLEKLGVPRIDSKPTETDHRKIWQVFAENFYLFRGTPTGIWLAHELQVVFGVQKRLNGETAQEIYDHIADILESAKFRPRTLFEHFNIEVLCTTDQAWDRLDR